MAKPWFPGLEQQAPLAQAGATMGWATYGTKGNRATARNGGYVPTALGGGMSIGNRYGVTKPPAAGAGEEQFPSTAALEGVGKTSLKIAAPTVTNIFDPNAQMPEQEKAPGFAEGVLKGLTEAFTGALPGWARDPIVNVATGVGRVADVPLEAVSHVPLPWQPDTKQAFEMLPESNQKSAVLQRIQGVDSTEAHWWMAEYVRSHGGDLAKAMGVPTLLQGFIQPDSTILERVLSGLGVASQVTASTIQRLTKSDLDYIQEAADLKGMHPEQAAVYGRYNNGDYGQPGSSDAISRLRDELTIAGFSYTDDPWMNMMLEMVLDPVIVTGEITGVAKIARGGALLRRAGEVNRVARASSNPVVRAGYDAARLVESEAATLRRGRRVLGEGESVEARIAKRLREDPNPDIQSAVRQADDEWRAGLGSRGRLRGNADLMLTSPLGSRMVLGAARVADVLNAPFGIFGRDGVAGAIGKAIRPKQTLGAFNAFGLGKVYGLFEATPSPLRSELETNLGYSIAHSERAINQSTLAKILRITGKGERAEFMPDNIDPGQVSDAMRRIDSPYASQNMELHLRETKIEVAPEAGMDPKQFMGQQRENAAAKWAEATGMDIEEARKAFKNADADEIAFADYAYFGKLIRNMVENKKADLNLAKQALAGAANAVRVAGKKQLKAATTAATEAEEAVSNIARQTLVGPRELTTARAIKLLEQIQKGDIAAAKDAVSRYDLLRQNFWSKVEGATDETFLHNMEIFLKDVLDKKSLVTTIKKESLGDNLKTLMEDVQTRFGDNSYEIGLAPSRESLWRTVTDEEGRAIGYVGWMDIDTAAQAMRGPTRLDVYRQALIGVTHGETIAMEARRKFVRDAHLKGVSTQDARTLWTALRKEAMRQGVTIRGLSEDSFKAIIDEADIPHELRVRMGIRDLQVMAVRALEGDLKYVGLSTKATGMLKSKTAKRGTKGNWVGFIAENIYPNIRFHYNPMFWIQEWIEPLYLNILRGVKPGVKYTEAAVKDMQDLLDNFDLGTGLSDGIEMRASLAMGAVNSHLGAGPNTGVAGLVERISRKASSVAQIKSINTARLTKERLGVYMRDSFERISPGAWADIRAVMNQIDMSHGGVGRLDDGEMAMRYLAQQGFYDPAGQHTHIQLYDASIPHDMGRIEGVRKSYLARAITGPNGETFASGADLRRAIADGELDEWDVRSQMAYMGYDPEYISRSWAVIRGVDHIEFLDGIQSDYAKFMGPAEAQQARDLMESLLQINAVKKGVDVEEYVATKFADNTRYLDSAGKLPYNAYTQLSDRLMEEAGWPVIPNNDIRVVRLTERARSMLPDVPHDTLPDHLRAIEDVKNGTEKITTARVQKNIKLGRFEIRRNMGAEEWKQINLAGMDQETIVGAGQWYRAMAPKFAAYAEMLDEETLRLLAKEMDRTMPMMKGIGGGDDFVSMRADVGARMLVAWGASQIQQSPRAGFGWILRSVDQMSRGKRTNVKMAGGFKIAQGPVIKMLQEFERNITIRGFGPKLHDFVDSLLGVTDRSFTRFDRTADTFVNGKGQHVFKQPGAMDIWMGRDMGFVDSGLISHYARKLGRDKGLLYDVNDINSPAMIQAQKDLGFFYRKMTTNADGEKVLENQEAYRARKRVFEEANGVELEEAWTGSPTAQEYEWMLTRYNEIVDQLNQGDGWLGRSYKHDPWTMADIQAISWVRIQKALDIDPGGPLNMFSQNAAQVAFEVVPGDHAPLRRAIPMHRATADAKDLITSDVAQVLAQTISQRTGATIVRTVPGMGGWVTDAGEHTIQPNTFWEIIGSDGQIRDAVDMLAYLTQQDSIMATRRPHTGPGGIPMTTSAGDRVWGLDFAPRVDQQGSVALTMEALRQYIDDGGMEWRGSMNGTREDGSIALRTLFFDVKKGSDVDAFAAAKGLPPGMEAKLVDGSWAVEAKFSETPIPVDIHRDLHDVISRDHDWAADQVRIDKRVAAGEDRATVHKEEMGRKILEDLRYEGTPDIPATATTKAKKGKVGRNRGSIADSLVDRDMGTLSAVWDDSLKRNDPAAWATGRGHEHLLSYYPESESFYTQNSPRGWRGGTAWDARNRATIYTNPRADLTTLVHENFHTWANELDPSGVEAVHRAWAKAVKKPLPKSHLKLTRPTEEWAAKQFELYVANGFGGVDLPADVLAVFNAYGDWGRKASALPNVQMDPRLSALFTKMNPGMHRGPMAHFDINQFRFMEAARISLQRAYQEAFEVQYWRRSRSWLERSVNHPYLGMYPASYMWGKVLPELMRFLIKKPFGVDAPFAGMAMANHVWQAMQIEMSSDSDFAEWVKAHPESLRFLSLLVPGTPWDIPVNAPAWIRRISQDALHGKDPNVGAALKDTLAYSFGAERGLFDMFGFAGDAANAVSSLPSVLGGTYESPDAKKAREKQEKKDYVGPALFNPTASPQPQQPQ